MSRSVWIPYAPVLPYVIPITGGASMVIGMSGIPASGALSFGMPISDRSVSYVIVAVYVPLEAGNEMVPAIGRRGVDARRDHVSGDGGWRESPGLPFPT